MNNEEEIRKIAQEVYGENSASREFTVSQTSFHKHNGTDSNRIKQEDIIPGTTAIAGFTTSTSETDILNTTKLITEVHLYGIAYSTMTRFPLTTAVAGGATSATLVSNWAYGTGTYTIYFSNGQTKLVTLTNGNAAVSWGGGISGYAVSAYIDTRILFDVTFSAAPSAGDLSEGLAAPWAHPTGEYTLTFSTGESHVVLFTNGYATALWNVALVADASDTATASMLTKKASLSGRGQLGNCYMYNWAGDVTAISTTGGQYEPFLQSCSSTYLDTNNIVNSKVLATGDTLGNSGWLACVRDETTEITASIQITKWSGTAITFDIFLQPTWTLTWYLSMS